MVVFLCGGCDCMWWWLYVVVEAVHGGDGHPCVAVYIYIYHQRKLHSVKTILGTSIGAGCSNQMQVAQGQDLH